MLQGTFNIISLLPAFLSIVSHISQPDRGQGKQPSGNKSKGIEQDSLALIFCSCKAGNYHLCERKAQQEGPFAYFLWFSPLEK